MSLPNCLLIVTAEVDSEVEAEWSRWYDESHLPDALACPGVLSGRRYRSVGEIAESDRGERRRGRPTLWTTVYELDLAGRRRDEGIHRHARLGPVRPARALADPRGVSAAALGWPAASGRSGPCRG